MGYNHRAPAVTDLADGISIPVDMMPEETGGKLFTLKLTERGIYYRAAVEEWYESDTVSLSSGGEGIPIRIEFMISTVIL